MRLHGPPRKDARSTDKQMEMREEPFSQEMNERTRSGSFLCPMSASASGPGSSHATGTWYDAQATAGIFRPMCAGVQRASAAKGTMAATMDGPRNRLLRNGAHPISTGPEIFMPRNPLLK